MYQSQKAYKLSQERQQVRPPVETVKNESYGGGRLSK
jgi:hypothetical protein